MAMIITSNSINGGSITKTTFYRVRHRVPDCQADVPCAYILAEWDQIKSPYPNQHKCLLYEAM